MANKDKTSKPKNKLRQLHQWLIEYAVIYRLVCYKNKFGIGNEQFAVYKVHLRQSVSDMFQNVCVCVYVCVCVCVIS